MTFTFSMRGSLLFLVILLSSLNVSLSLTNNASSLSLALTLSALSVSNSLNIDNSTYLAFQAQQLEFQFFIPTQQEPTIISPATIMEKNGTQTITTNLVPITWSQNEEFGVHLWKVIPGGVGLTFVPTGTFLNGPVRPNQSITSTNGYNFENLEALSDLSSLGSSQLMRNSESVVATLFAGLSHVNPNTQAFCRLRIFYSGLIDSIWLNGMFVGYGSSEEDNTLVFFLSVAQYNFEKSQFNLIQIFGRHLSIQSFNVTECADSPGGTLLTYDPILETYSPFEDLGVPEKINFTANTECAKGCNLCSSGYCFDCGSNPIAYENMSCEALPNGFVISRGQLLQHNFVSPEFYEMSLLISSTETIISPPLSSQSFTRYIILMGRALIVSDSAVVVNYIDQVYYSSISNGNAPNFNIPSNSAWTTIGGTFSNNWSSSGPFSLWTHILPMKTQFGVGIKSYPGKYSQNTSQFPANQTIIATFYAQSNSLVDTCLGIQTETAGNVYVTMNGETTQVIPSNNEAAMVIIIPSVLLSSNPIYHVQLNFTTSIGGAINFNPNLIPLTCPAASIYSGSQIEFTSEHSQCPSGDIFQPKNLACIPACPAGFYQNSFNCENPCLLDGPAFGCKTRPAVFLYPTNDLTLCHDSSLNLEIEYFVPFTTVEWNASSNSSTISGLLTFLNTETKPSISIPKSLLEFGQAYNFSAIVMTDSGANLTSQYQFPNGLNIYTNAYTGNCSCPPLNYEISENSANQIECGYFNPIPFTILYNSTSQKLQLSFDYDPNVEGSPIVTWSISIPSQLESQSSSLISFIGTQTQNSITISKSLLLPGTSYSFSASYNNNYGKLRTGTSSYETPSFLSLQTTSSTIQTISNFEALNISLQVNQTFSLPIQYEALLIEDDDQIFNLKNMASITSNFAYIPPCTFQSEEEIIIEIKAQYEGFPTTSQSIQIELTTLPEKFVPTINGGNRTFPYGSDLILYSNLNIITRCSISDSSASYIWSCHESNSQPCSDPNSIFNVSSASSGLTIPVSYFSQGEILQIGLTVTRQTNIESTEVFITIGSPNALNLEIACDQPYYHYQSDTDFNFKGLISGTPIPPSATLTWSVTGSSSPLPTVSFLSAFRIRQNTYTFLSTENSVVISLTATYQGETGSASLTLPVNHPPSGGSITVTPQSGTSLQTMFTISASGWTDSNLPLMYQFWMKLSTDAHNQPITPPVYSNSISTMLPANSASSAVTLTITVIDLLSATTNQTTTVTVSNQFSQMSLCAQTISNLLSTGQFSPSAGLILAEVIAGLEQINANYEVTNYCPLCSGHGSCVNKRCQCDPGYAYLDCSLQTSQFNSFLDLKPQFLQYLMQNIGGINIENPIGSVILSIVNSLFQDPIIQSEASLTQAQSILQGNLEITNPVYTINSSQITQLGSILDKMISHQSYSDCSATSATTQNLAQVTLKYFSTMTRNTLRNKLPGEPIQTYEMDSYILFSAVTTVCSLSNQTLGNSRTPTITLQAASGANFECNKEINVHYFALNSEIFNCEGPSIGRILQSSTLDSIGLEVIDPLSGEQISSSFSASVTYTDGTPCSSGCQTLADGSCYCGSADTFDLTQTIYTLFKVTFTNSSEPSWSAFKEGIMFWMWIGFTIWLMVTLMIVNSFIPYKDIYSAFQNMNFDLKTKFRSFITSFIILHPFLNIYLYRDITIGKTGRTMLFYIRIIVIMALTSLLIRPIGNGDFTQELGNFTAIIFVMPYFTFIPLNGVLKFLFRFSLIVNEDNRKIVRRKLMKRRALLVAAIVILIITLCLTTIMIMSKTLDYNRQIAWAAQFVFVVIQDFTLNPFTLLLIDHFYRILRRSDPQKPKQDSKLQIFERIFVRNSLNGISMFETKGKTKINPGTTILPTKLEKQDLFRSPFVTPNKPFFSISRGFDNFLRGQRSESKEVSMEFGISSGKLMRLKGLHDSNSERNLDDLISQLAPIIQSVDAEREKKHHTLSSAQSGSSNSLSKPGSPGQVVNSPTSGKRFQFNDNEIVCEIHDDLLADDNEERKETPPEVKMVVLPPQIISNLRQRRAKKPPMLLRKTTIDDGEEKFSRIFDRSSSKKEFDGTFASTLALTTPETRISPLKRGGSKNSEAEEFIRQLPDDIDLVDLE